MLLAAGQCDIILGGDLNLVLDRSNLKKSKMLKDFVKLQNMCKAFGLVVIWRILNPDGREYTFYSAPHKLYSIIDYFFGVKVSRLWFYLFYWHHYNIRSCLG